MDDTTGREPPLGGARQDQVNRALSAWTANPNPAASAPAGSVAKGSQALRAMLAQALADNAESLGTADLDHEVQMTLYDRVAEAVIATALANDDYLTQLATDSVRLRERVLQMISTEVVASEARETVIGISMA